MPTYQTTPYMEWAFPDDTVRANVYGVKPLLKTRIPKQKFEVGDNAVHNYFAENARAQAMARVVNSQIKEAGMLGFGPPRTARTQRYILPASRSSVPNGKFMPPSYEYTQTPSGLRGGTGLLTKEGREWIHKRLKQRITELDAIDSGTPSPPSRPIEVIPNTGEIDSLFSQIIDSLAVAAVVNSLPETALKLQTAILKTAPLLTMDDLARFAQSAVDIQTAIRSLTASKGKAPSAEKKFVLQALMRVIVRIETIIRELSPSVHESADVKRLVASEIANRIPRAERFEAPNLDQQAGQRMAQGRRTAAQIAKELADAFSPQEKANIKQRVEDGEDVNEIAQELEVPVRTIRLIVES